MASENHETVADVLAECRREYREILDTRLYAPADYIKTLIDRVSAAVEREREAVGSAAAIYAALVKIHDMTNALDEKCGVDPVEIRDIARAALSKPARNCDVMSRSMCTTQFSTRRRKEARSE